MTNAFGKAGFALAARRLVLLVAVVGCGGSAKPAATNRDAQAPFNHDGITDNCTACHGTNQPFAAFPAGAGHRPIGVFDCSLCHQASAGTWAGARFHTQASATPATCVPCHQAQAPSNTAGWTSTTYAASPFDYGGNSLGVAHGGGQDCAVCHVGPGTGTWGGRPNWVGGHFSHATFSLAEDTCIACHVSQRPDLQSGANAETAAAQIGFDHAPVASLDCIGCHSATVARDSYVSYLNPITSVLPGGDWRGGQSFPGSRPVGFPGERLELWTTTLALSASGDRVTGTSGAWEDLFEVMIHTSVAVPPQLRPGTTEAVDYGKCWHCHVNKNGVVTMFPMGKFHHALALYAVTPDAPVTPLPQPTQGCKECHGSMQPIGVVGPSPQPMQHGIGFASPATVAGATVTSVKDLDCSACHVSPTGGFAHGTFHPNTASATLRECVSCHYLTMADETTADLQSGTVFRMRHASAEMPFHTCTTCHPSALTALASPIVAPESWKPGVYHAVLPAQPVACNDCHAVSAPAGHDKVAAGRDCGECHSFPGTGTSTTPNWLGAGGLP